MRRVPIMDYVQEGNIALLEAARKFDYTKGYRFSTYAYNTVKYKLIRVAETGRMIRMPTRAYRNLAELAATRETLTQELARAPTIIELSEATGFAVSKIHYLIASRNDAGSLDHRLSNDKESDTILDFIADEGPTGQQELETSEFRETTQRMLQRLTDRERRVIEMRFGFGEYQNKGQQRWKDIAEEVGVHISSAKLIEQNALWRLRNFENGAMECFAEECDIA
jgi:RNA polymerase primary sigma factor